MNIILPSEVFSLLKAEQGRLMTATDLYVPYRRLVTEAIIKTYGPRHPKLHKAAKDSLKRREPRITANGRRG